MANYSVYLPNYSVGPDCYKEIPYVTRHYGKKACVIGGETALSKATQALKDGVAGSNVELTGFLPYGGDSTYENGQALLDNPLVQEADMLFAVGGGRACDTVKYVADVLDKPLFTFPTVGSNCAPVTAICVMYNADHTFKDYYYPKLMNHCFINTQIISDSPENLLWAGIGDALSKEIESVFASKDDKLAHTPLMGAAMSHVCTDPLIENGAASLDAIRVHQHSDALQQVVLDIIISTGVVSNCMTTENDYYYNSTLAHCVYYGSTVTKKGHAHLHGEVVSLGVLCLLQYSKQFEEMKRIMEFNASIGLPVCFDDVEITEDEFDAMADKFTQTKEWSIRPSGVTREGFLEAMKQTNQAGRAFKALQAA